MIKTRVLVVEDDCRYRDLLKLNLAGRGYEVQLAQDGLSGLNLLERDGADLVILDLMLPDIDGFEVCARIRQYNSVPILVLTAKSEEPNKVRGLRLGADDYVTKPFGAEELLARVEALLRRSRLDYAAEPAVFVSGNLAIDFPRCRVTRGGCELKVSPTEFKILRCLARHASYVIVHEELLRSVWGHDYEGEVALLHTNMRRLRRKVEEHPRNPRYIITKRGIGYCLIQHPS